MHRFFLFAGTLTLAGLLVTTTGCGNPVGADSRERDKPVAGPKPQGEKNAGALDVVAVADEKGDWGTLTGQIIWGKDAIPTPETLKVEKDVAHCLSKGKLLSDKFVINPKNKGVRWVMVWLVDPKNPKKAPPIHPSLKEAAKEVVVDQPCCMFEPHMLGMRTGQVLVAKNSSPVAHNFKIDGPEENPNINPLIPAGKEVKIEPWVAHRSPSVGSCVIHPWMKMYIRVFDHPYFAVTDENGNFTLKDAPAGDWKMVIWHEEQYVTGGKDGIPVTIKKGEKTALDPIKFTPE